MDEASRRARGEGCIASVTVPPAHASHPSPLRLVTPRLPVPCRNARSTLGERCRSHLPRDHGPSIMAPRSCPLVDHVPLHHRKMVPSHGPVRCSRPSFMLRQTPRRTCAWHPLSRFLAVSLAAAAPIPRRRPRRTAPLIPALRARAPRRANRPHTCLPTQSAASRRTQYRAYRLAA